MRFFPILAAIFLLSISSLIPAEAQVAYSTQFDENGLTIFTHPFLLDDGKIAIEGLGPSTDNPPLFFLCGEPGDAFSLEAYGQKETLSKITKELFSDCFAEAAEGKVKMAAPNGLIFPTKNFAACGCTEQQIDNFFYLQACQNSERFLKGANITEACGEWRATHSRAPL